MGSQTLARARTATVDPCARMYMDIQHACMRACLSTRNICSMQFHDLAHPQQACMHGSNQLITIVNCSSRRKTEANALASPAKAYCVLLFVFVPVHRRCKTCSRDILTSTSTAHVCTCTHVCWDCFGNMRPRKRCLGYPKVLTPPPRGTPGVQFIIALDHFDRPCASSSFCFLRRALSSGAYEQSE